jgi:GMP synthase PP-ATPase subunit
MHAFREDAIERIRPGNGRLISRLSGGVDSKVRAVLIHPSVPTAAYGGTKRIVRLDQSMSPVRTL